MPTTDHNSDAGVVVTAVSISAAVDRARDEIGETVSRLDALLAHLSDTDQALRVPEMQAMARRRNATIDALLDGVRGLANVMEQHVEPSRSSSLTEDQAHFLIESGVFTADELEETEASVAAGALEVRATVTQAATDADALSAEDIGALLKITGNRARGRVSEGTLYSYLRGQKHLFPAWQVTSEGNPLPNLPKIIKAIPEDWLPASVHGFMTTPQEDLKVQGKPVTPVEWLAGGGSPEPVVTLLQNPYAS